MHVARQNHVAALLQNGSVLVAGGHPGNNLATATAEIYNPYGLTWTTVGSMSTPRRLFGACTLPNGKVLVAGGNTTSRDVASAELFDSATNTWSTTGSLATAREDFSTTCLADGRVLVAGGSGPPGILSSAEVYNPATGKWSTAGTIPFAVHTQGAVQLADGRVLIAGGNNALGPINQAALWNPSTNAWTATGSMSTTRSWHAVSLLNDGRVLAAGGLVNLLLTTSNTAEIYDPAKGTWSAAASLHAARYSGASATLAGGPVLIGGVNGGLTVASTVKSSEQYDNVHNTWTLTAGASGAVNQTATALPSSDLLVTGGNTGLGATTITQVYGVCSNTAARDGTACDSGNKCTQSDACQSGVCLPGEQVPSCQAPAWSGAAVAYKVNDVVSFEGIIYRNLRVHTSTPQLTPAVAHGLWAATAPMIVVVESPPAWFAGGAIYEVNDVVSYGGSSYRDIVPHKSTPALTPVARPDLWQRLVLLPDGVVNGACLPPTQMESIDHCLNGLGCNWATNTCEACGGSGQPCCDGANTPFAGICFLDPLRPDRGCPVCNAGACDDATHTCLSCGLAEGDACCGPDESNAFAHCTGSGVVCNWNNSTMTAGTCVVNCGGIDEPACAGGGCQSGLRPVDGGICVAPPPPDLNLASIAVTGPLTVQGVVPWQNCIVYFDPPPEGPPAELRCLQPTTGPGAPTPSENNPPEDPSLAPRWMEGSGLTFSDSAQGQSYPKLYTPDPSVTLRATVSFTDDTSKLAEKVADQDGNLICTTSVLPGMFEGNHAHYTVTVQHWVDNAESCPAPRASDPDYPAVVFDGPSPTGLAGCWTDLAVKQTDLYGSSFGPPGATVAPQDGTVSTTLPLSVDLPGVSNFLRYVIDVWEGDTRISTSVNGVGWPDDAWTCPGRFGMGACEDTGSVCPGYQSSPGGLFEHVDVVHPLPTFAFSYSRAFTPFQLVVQPLALAQLKVMPYTLLYAPPGNASKATYQTSTSFGVNMAFDNKLAGNTSNTVDNKNTVALSISGMASLATGATAPGMGASWGNVGIGETIGNSTSFDQSTKLGVGTIGDVATGQMTTYQTIAQFSVSVPSTTPGANETRDAEPFWSDTFVLLVHPQIGLWQLGGVPVVSMLAARGTPASPDFFEPTVADLAACAMQAAPFEFGIPIQGTADVLSSSECAGLLTLDPLYSVGQTFPGAASSNRFVHAGGSDYGIDPTSKSDFVYSLTSVLTNTNTSTVQKVGSYTGTITNILTTTDSASLSLSAFGITASISLMNTDNITNATDWTVTLQSSYTATAQSSVSITGSLDDHHGLSGAASLPYRPHAEVYRDTVFGSFLFVDPTAP